MDRWRAGLQVVVLLVFASIFLGTAWAPADQGAAEADRGGPPSDDRGPARGLDLEGLSALDLALLGGGAEETAGAQEPRPSAGYDSKLGGFFLQSPDGKFLLRFNARLQLRYTNFVKDVHSGDREGLDESYFKAARARLGMSGHLFDPRIKFKFEIDSGTDQSDKGVLTDAYVLYAHADWLSLGLGQFHPFFLREEYTSSSKFQRVERALANEFFNMDRSIGVWAEGEPAPWLYYNAGVTNGIDAFNISPGGGSSSGTVLDQPPACFGKLDFTLAGDHAYSLEESDLKGLEKPLFVVGGSFLQQTYNDTHEARTFITTPGSIFSFGVDAVFKYRGFSLLGEYIGRWYDQNGPTTPVIGSATPAPRTDALYAHGFTVQGGYFVLRKPDIELNGRVSAIYGNEGPQKGTGYEVGPGVSWFFSRSHSGKIQLDVAWVDIDGDLPAQTELLRLGPSQVFTTTAAGFSEGEQGVLTRVQVHLSF